MQKLLTLKNFLKVNTIFLIPLLLLLLGLIYTNNFNLNIKNLSETYLNIIFIVLFFPVVFLFYIQVENIPMHKMHLIYNYQIENKANDVLFSMQYLMQ